MSNLTKERKKEIGAEIRLSVQSVQQGDASKVDDLAKLILSSVKPVIAKYYKDYNDRIEVANYIATKIINKVSYIDIDKPVLNYILFTTKNYCIDEYRKMRRKAGKVITADNEMLDLLPHEDQRSSMKYEDYIDLYTIVCDGDLSMAAVIYALEQENLPVEEVAGLYYMDVKTIKAAHRAALINLKNMKRKLSASRS